MELHTYRFRLRAEDRMRFDGFPGIVLRGALGEMLRRGTCPAWPSRSTADCPLPGGCTFHKLFQPKRPDLPPRFRNPPPPFVLRPCFPAGTYRPGSLLSFDFTIVGAVGPQLRDVLGAFMALGDVGIGTGRGTGNGIGRFTLERVAVITPQGARPLIESGSAFIRPFVAPRVFPRDFDDQGLSTASEGTRIVVELQTPTQIREPAGDDHVFTFREIIEAIVSRLDLLGRAYSGGTLFGAARFRDLAEQASEITLIDADVACIELPRFSTRQRQVMQFTGSLGTLTFRGDPSPWLPYLRVASLLHVGRHTAFGFGCIMPRTA